MHFIHSTAPSWNTPALPRNSRDVHLAPASVCSTSSCLFSARANYACSCITRWFKGECDCGCGFGHSVQGVDRKVLNAQMVENQSRRKTTRDKFSQVLKTQAGLERIGNQTHGHDGVIKRCQTGLRVEVMWSLPTGWLFLTRLCQSTVDAKESV